MTATEMVTVLGAAAGLVTTLGGVIVLVIKTWKDEIKSDMKVIQNSVDGTASKQEAKLNAALEKLEFVSTRLNREETKAAVLAASVAAPSPVAVPAAAQSLDNIDTSTKVIAVNTEKTKDIVQDLKEK
jgi:uncharacterized protein YyaL (SSP411 family)